MTEWVMSAQQPPPGSLSVTPNDDAGSKTSAPSLLPVVPMPAQLTDDNRFQAEFG